MTSPAVSASKLELLERAVEQAPAWGIPRLLAIQNLQTMWADARQRVYDSHKLECKALGGEAGELEDVGDIKVRGDSTQTHHHYYGPKPSAAAGGTLSKLAVAAALACGVPVLGFAGAWAYDHFMKQQPAATQPVQPPSLQDWQLDIQVSDAPDG